METANYSGSITAIAAVVVTVLAKFGLNIQSGDVATILLAIIALIGIIKQMFDHKKVVNTVNEVVASSTLL